jgi:hypothetical protein
LRIVILASPREVLKEFLISMAYRLTPQETTKQDARDIGADGAELSCPGSSVLAEERIDGC